MTLRVLLATVAVLAAAVAPTAAETDRRGPQDASGTAAASVAQAAPAKVTRLRGHSEKSARSLAGSSDMLTPEQEARFTAAFSELDADSDGAISSGELTLAASPPGQNSIAVDVLQSFSAVDMDDSGDVSLAEFAIFAQERERRENDGDSAITEVFRIFDYDGDCLISADELRLALRIFHFPPSEAAQIESLLALALVDVDGQLDEDEFAAALLRP